MSAYHMIASQGDPEKWKTAQKSILHSLIGIFLVFSIFAILKFAGTILNIDGLSNLKVTWPGFLLNITKMLLKLIIINIINHSYVAKY